ncbi:hypothetical protein ACFL13_01525 [Patescibacteria group bacterium]
MPNLFTNDQIKRMSNILDNSGQVILGSVVISSLVGPEKLSGTIIVGIFSVLSVWWISLRLERRSSS